jgi:hypothetical protein
MSREDEDRLRYEDDLSAFLDGELDPEREAAVRAALARSPALAARLAELRAVDEGLRGTDAPPVPSDLRARLQARIEAGVRDVPPAGRAPRRRRRWLSAPALAAAAVAAVLALMLLVRRPGEERPPERVAGERTPAVPEAPGLPVPEAPAAPSPPPERIAAPAPGPEPAIPAPEAMPPAPERAPPSHVAEQPAPTPPPDAVAPVELSDASDEELEVAMDWEVIEDLELIEELELLEAMARAEQGRS